MKKITVHLAERSYSICIGSSWNPLRAELASLRLGPRALIVSNRRVRGLTRRPVERALRQAGAACDWLMLPDHEGAKSVSVYARALQHIARRYGTRPLYFVALGGGVIGDICGFMAATYRRGVAYVQIPTTLLAQVDAAIGGKTAVDLPAGKNLAGVFYQPRLVFSNTAVLASLPPRQLRSGCAELIKYGVIADAGLLDYLETAVADICSAQPEALQYVVTAASKIKARMVSLDERETSGLRSLLNFGHTVGHAWEAATGFRRLTHGEAVSIGMLSACDIACAEGLCEASFRDRLERIIRCYGLPAAGPRVSPARLMRALRQDKKFIRGQARLVLPLRAGHVIVTESVPLGRIARCITKRVGSS